MRSKENLLVMLCSCTWLLFGDRGVISSNEVSGDWGIRKEFTNVTIAQSGWLFSCNMVSDFCDFSSPKNQTIGQFLGLDRITLD